MNIQLLYIQPFFAVSSSLEKLITWTDPGKRILPMEHYIKNKRKAVQHSKIHKKPISFLVGVAFKKKT